MAAKMESDILIPENANKPLITKGFFPIFFWRQAPKILALPAPAHYN